MAGTPEGKYEPEWGNDDLKFEDTKDPTAEIKKKMAENKREAAESHPPAGSKASRFLTELFNDVQDLKERTGVNQEERQAFQDEQQKISEDIAAKRKELEERKKDLADLKRKEEGNRRSAVQAEDKRRRAPATSARTASTWRSRASSRRKASDTGGKPRPARFIGMNQAEERTTQWVRATYPYVDAFRAPISPCSTRTSTNAKRPSTTRNGPTATRSPSRGSSAAAIASAKPARDATGNDFGEWYRDGKSQPLTAYVMVERFDPDKKPHPPKPGAQRIQKGYEEWTKDTEDGQEHGRGHAHRRGHDPPRNRAPVLAGDLPGRDHQGNDDLRPGHLLQRQRANAGRERQKIDHRRPRSAGTRSTGTMTNPFPNGATSLTKSPGQVPLGFV